jgi:hypothetical protein
MSGKITRKHFSVSTDGSSIELFGLPGALFSKGTWEIGQSLGGSYIRVEVAPAPARQFLEDAVREDVKAGKEHLISYVLINSRTAVRLFLEGFLTPALFEQATETSSFVIVKAEVGGKLRDIVIRSEQELQLAGNGVATCDKDGNII